MKPAFHIVAVILILAIVADAANLTSIGSETDVPASVDGKVSRFWSRKKPTEDAPETRPTARGVHGDRRLDAGEGEHESAESKICHTHGLCYKKKLVCPKSCKGTTATLDGASTNHEHKHCIFDCKKCIAYC